MFCFALNKALGYNIEKQVYIDNYKLIFYWLRLFASLLNDIIKRMIVMIWIDKKLYPFPGSIKF